MEHLHTLINGIDNLKEHMTDNEYLQLMSSISKLSEIINSYDNNSENESIYSDSSNNDEQEDEEEEIEIVDVDLLLETIKHNEIVFNNFMKNVPDELKDDFLSSKFNVINQNAFNYIQNNTCDCKDELDLCNDINNLYSCKNYQSFILQYPIVHLIVKRNCACCVNSIIEDINKYHLFQIDGKIKFNTVDEKMFNKTITSLMNMMPKINDSKYQIILFLNIFNFVFNNGNILIKNDKFKEAVLNKLKTDGKYGVATENTLYWSNIFNFDKNIIDIMISNLTVLQ